QQRSHAAEGFTHGREHRELRVRRGAGVITKPAPSIKTPHRSDRLTFGPSATRHASLSTAFAVPFHSVPFQRILRPERLLHAPERAALHQGGRGLSDHRARQERGWTELRVLST